MTTSHKKLKLKPQERDIQAVLDVVIRHGYYLPSSRIGFVPRMSMSLINAKANKLITTKEYEKTIEAIRLYRGTDTTLARALLKSKLPCSYYDCLSVYSNWEDRPELCDYMLDTPRS